MTQELLDKLPKWAQREFLSLQQQRDAAVRSLNEFTDGQTPSNAWVDDVVCTGEHRRPDMKRHFVQSDSVTFELAKGREVDVRVDCQKEELVIHGSVGKLSIFPQASNAIHITLDKLF